MRHSAIWLNIKLSFKALKRFFQEKYSYRASALAFTTLLALVPFLFVMVFFATTFPFFSNIVSSGEGYIINNFVPESAIAIQTYFEVFVKQASQLPTFSILFLFITAGMLVYTIEDTMNDIYHTPKENYRFHSSLIFGLIILLMPFIIGLSVFWTTYLFSLPWLININNPFHFLAAYTPILINTLIFSLIYKVTPHARIRWRDCLAGGLVVSILFEVARIGFAFFIKQFPTYALIYGAFAILPTFLFWLYIFWSIVLFGALFIYLKTTSHQSIR